MLKKDVYLVLDVGKTNKKLFLYDESLQVVWSSCCEMDLLKQGGLEFEAVKQLLDWFADEVAKISLSYHFLAFVISSHGATFALLDEKDELCIPVLSYTSQVPEHYQTAFYANYGSEEELLRQTGTPDLGFINIGKALSFLSETQSSQFKKTKTFLFYPQYLAFLFTRVKSIEYTYLGNHSYLWDFVKGQYSSFSRQIGIDSSLPQEIQKPWDILGGFTQTWQDRLKIDYHVPILVGVHDSNAALFPYLLKGMKRTILLSTGSWCVGMRPDLPYEFSEADIASHVFFNIDCWGMPLKTSIFTGGLEYAYYAEQLQEQDPADLVLLQQVVLQENLFVLPGLIKGAGIFKDAVAAIIYKDRVIYQTEFKQFFQEHSELVQQVYTALNLSLAIQTDAVLTRLQAEEGANVYIEGGFLKNKVWLEALFNLRSELNFFASNLKEASAFGASLLAKMVIEKVSPEQLATQFELVLQKQTAKNQFSMSQYQNKFNHFLQTIRS